MSAAVQVTFQMLPVELILKIFHMTTFDGTDHNVPLALSHVSRGCRSIVSSEARLWTNIKVDNQSAVGHPRRVGANPQDVFPALSVYLRNSSQLPFNLLIEYVGLPRYEKDPGSYDFSEPRTDGFTLSHATHLGSILAAHVHRLQSLTVDTFSWEIYTLIVNQWAGLRLPLVGSWSVKYGNVRDLYLFNVYSDMLQFDIGESENILTNGGVASSPDELAGIGGHYFPRLKRLRLWATPHQWTFSTRNLVELVLKNMPESHRTTDELLRVILANSQHTLQILELNGVLHPWVSPPSARLSLPAVHTLRIGFSYVEEIATLLRIAEFPALTNLWLKHLLALLNENTRHQEEMADMFDAMVDELPLRQLTALYIEAVSFPRENLHRIFTWEEIRNGTVPQDEYPDPMRFISQLNALQSLTLVRPDPMFLQSMNYSPPRSLLFLPSLWKLRFETSIPTDYLCIVEYWSYRMGLLMHASGGRYLGPGLERLELLLPDTVDKVGLARWIHNRRPYVQSMVVGFQPEDIPFVLAEDESDFMAVD
ncbi:uncharacterized protein BT62DRAFT_642031 [Guyanagaster necrorhizus]|uniref:Uncharacterized protein n=1 Tax=Guyanagaster necrorhizus TaxID=856835 RepID=A0A9P7VFM4_9AGAR|nr:uncharacterized protein BT62DRAFT_642031 [Guyanagaster necrorhizus MCA 3950]KAG7440053.1 hypothetical protein BT62DRAFT_642031 [Guyanagaster necrorhizus MCA 3950]